MTTTTAPPAVPMFLQRESAMPFCKGCGHTHVLRKLDEVLISAGIAPSDVCLVTDIGCIGLADSLFPTVHTVHTTHGRSTAFATGIAISDHILSERKKLKTIVLIGDGGAMIGLLHLVNAALLNTDVTVILCNNFLFGMTGGQHSAFSPIDFITPTTPAGNIIPPLDICLVMVDAHAGFVARTVATDKEFPGLLSRAIAHPGFSLIEVVELCTEHGVPRNPLSGSALRGIVESHGQQLGVLCDDGGKGRAEFGALYRSKFPASPAPATGRGDGYLQPRLPARLESKIGIVIAGSAGERVQSAAGIFCEAAALASLHCSQKNDNPVTQGSGFSLAEVCISPHEIHYTGIEAPDVLIVVSAEGLKELEDRDMFRNLTPSTALYLDASLETPETAARVHRHAFRIMCGAGRAASAALVAYLTISDIFPSDLYMEILASKTSSKGPIFSKEFYAFLQTIQATPGA